MEVVKRPPRRPLAEVVLDFHDAEDEPIAKRLKTAEDATYLRVDQVFAIENGNVIVCEGRTVGKEKDEVKRVKLCDGWRNADVKVGGLISVVNPIKKPNGDWVISNEGGLISIEPLYLISPTTMAGSCFCERKSMLQERFRGSGSNKSMLLGIIVHDVFQKALTQQLERPSTEALKELALSQLKSTYGVDLVLLKEGRDAFLADLDEYMEHVGNWLRKYAPRPVGFSKPFEKGMKIHSTEAIEQYISDKALGLKGKLDVSMKMNDGPLIHTLELKTGKSSCSFEHQLQVHSYNTMLQRNFNEGALTPGWLLYLKDLILAKVETRPVDQRGVMFMRNKLAAALSNLTISSFPGNIIMPHMPLEICKDIRFCKSCEQNANCALVHRLADEPPCPIPETEVLMTDLLKHLSEEELKYASTWMRWQFAEWEEQTHRGQKAFLRGDTKEIENGIPFALGMQNVADLMADKPAIARLRSLLISLKKPQTEKLNAKSAAAIKPIIDTLDKEQLEAVRACLQAKDFAIIQGYPGSGKTTTICSFIRCCLKLGRSVLVSAHTNSAVDNVLNKLAPYISETQALRIGTLKSIHPSIQRFSLEERLKTANCENVDEALNNIDDMLRKTPIVFTTCLTASSHPLFAHRRFDYCIVDEASQAVENIVLRPLMTASTFVLFGDNRQLCPLVVNKQVAQEGMGVSLMERLINAHGSIGPHSVVLNHQYRMNQAICALSSDLFYDGSLLCANETVANAILNLPADLNDENVKREVVEKLISSKLEDSVLFFDTFSKRYGRSYATEFSVSTRSRFNAGEAADVVRICSFFASAGLDPDSIGIISPYRGQVDYITNRLKVAFPEKAPECSTIDRYQGRDKPIIIISLVDGGPEAEKQSPDLLSNPNRLNVALSRARSKLIMVGCRDTLAQSPLINSLLKKVNNFIHFH